MRAPSVICCLVIEIFAAACPGRTLAAEPPVQVGLSKQLFVDDFVIAEMTGLTRRLGTVQKANNGSPLQFTRTVNGAEKAPIDVWPLFTSVYFDSSLQRFRMWHRISLDDKSRRAAKGQVTAEEIGVGTSYHRAYSESVDGTNFELVSLLQGLTTSGDTNLVVTIDEHESDPAHRYKIGYDCDGPVHAAALAHSPDGILWTPYNGGRAVTYRASEFPNQIEWDSAINAYRLLTRTDFGAGGGPFAGKVDVKIGDSHLEVRGVVAAANYEARKFGVHSAMAAARARRLCPHAIVIKPRIDYYASVSRQIRDIFEQFTPLVEPLSLDEAFLDVTGSESLFGCSAEIGRQIKQRIRAELRLTASVGVATNKFVAKIASALKKPDGFFVVESGGKQAFLDPLPVGRLWGVGKVTGQVFERLEVRTIGQLRQMPLATLTELFGVSGEHYWQLAHGIDDRRVVPDREAKSISNETTFAEDIADIEVLRAWLVELVEQVARRLRRHDIKGRTVELNVRFADFQTITRSMTLAKPTSITQELLDAGVELLTKRLPARQQSIRVLGFGVNKLDGSGKSQQALFDQPDRGRQQELDRVADQITEKFGKLAIRRGTGLDRGDERGRMGGSNNETSMSIISL